MEKKMAMKTWITLTIGAMVVLGMRPMSLAKTLTSNNSNSAQPCNTCKPEINQNQSQNKKSNKKEKVGDHHTNAVDTSQPAK